MTAEIELAVLDAGLEDGNWFRSFDTARTVLSAQRAGGARIVFSTGDLDAWSWNTQTITLSKAATDRLLAALPAENELTASVRAMRNMHRQLGWGNPIGLALHTRAFLVSLQDAALYGGAFLEAVSERPLNIPVLRTRLEDGRAVFNLLPAHLPFLMVDPGSPDAEITPAQVAPEARQDWPMAKMMLRTSYGPEVVRIRDLLRDSRLHLALERAGKLA